MVCPPGRAAFNYHTILKDDRLKIALAHPGNTRLKGERRRTTFLLAVYPSGCKVLEGLVCLAVPVLERFLLAHPSTESGRFLLWARREVVGPWEKKAYR